MDLTYSTATKHKTAPIANLVEQTVYRQCLAFVKLSYAMEMALSIHLFVSKAYLQFSVNIYVKAAWSINGSCSSFR